MVPGSLSPYSVADLAEVFNEAFSDYLLPISLSETQLRDKILSENIQPELSVGITAHDKLVGFIFIGTQTRAGKTMAYNAGTGVIPEFRGKGLPAQMYAYLLPLLRAQGITEHLLEVITQNTKALSVYKRLGYTVSRTLDCFRGKVIAQEPLLTFPIKKIALPKPELVQPCWNHHPAYQNTPEAIHRNSSQHEALGIFDGGALIAYIVYVKNATRVKQFGVDARYRRKGLGRKLFSEIQQNNPEQDIVLTNVERADEASVAFLKQIGLAVFISQYEMILHQ